MQVPKTIPIKQENPPHAVIGIENDTYPIKGRAIRAICVICAICAIGCHFVTLFQHKMSFLAENLQNFAKNGFGKGFAVLKGVNKIGQNGTKFNKQIKTYNYGKDYWY